MNVNFKYSQFACIAILLLTAGCTTPSPAPPVASVPAMANCTCYFGQHAECKDKDGREMACTDDWSPKNCIRREPKGGADFGKCTRTVPGQPLIAGCDGSCAPKSNGSACGGFEVGILTEGLSLWRDAINEAARSDRTDIGSEVVERVAQLPLSDECAYFVGRTALAVMELCRSRMTTHPSHEHHTHEHPIANLSGDTCQLEAGDICFEALLTAFEDPGAVPEITSGIVRACPDQLPFSAPCTDDFECVNRTLRISAEVMQIRRPASILEGFE